MRPQLELLSDELGTQIIEEGYALLMNPGIWDLNDEIPSSGMAGECHKP